MKMKHRPVLRLHLDVDIWCMAPYFISQFMLQKRGLHGKTACINAVIMLSTSFFHL